MPNEITLPNWQNTVRRVFGLVGPGGNVPVLSPEIQPVVLLQPDNPEFRRLRKEALWSGGRGSSSAAGTLATGGMVNPSTSGTLAVIERVTCHAWSAIANLECRLLIDTEANVIARCPNVATAADSSPRDTRTLVPGAGQPGVVIRYGAAAGALTGFVVRRFFTGNIGDPSNEEARDIVLTPGWGIYFACVQAGAGQTVLPTFEWYERPMETAELNG